jgi:hypothetical protein
MHLRHDDRGTFLCDLRPNRLALAGRGSLPARDEPPAPAAPARHAAAQHAHHGGPAAHDAEQARDLPLRRERARHLHLQARRWRLASLPSAEDLHEARRRLAHLPRPRDRCCREPRSHRGRAALAREGLRRPPDWVGSSSDLAVRGSRTLGKRGRCDGVDDCCLTIAALSMLPASRPAHGRASAGAHAAIQGRRVARRHRRAHGGAREGSGPRPALASAALGGTMTPLHPDEAGAMPIARAGSEGTRLPRVPNRPVPARDLVSRPRTGDRRPRDRGQLRAHPAGSTGAAGFAAAPGKRYRVVARQV